MKGDELPTTDLVHAHYSSSSSSSMTVLFRFIGQHLPDASHNLATFTFDLVSHGACRWYESSYSTSVPSFKFVSLFLRTIWRTSSLNISRRGDLDLWPWNWCSLLPVRSTIFIPILVFLGRFILNLSANTCQTSHVTLRPYPLTLEVTALVGHADLRSASVY